jgi:hypothetical protein
MDATISKAISQHFKDEIPADVEKQGRIAGWDLWNGPITFCEECGADHLPDCTCEIKYKGFQAACKVVSDWLDDNASTLYVCLDSGIVSDKEPEGEWLDEDGEPCDSDAEGAIYSEPMPYAEVSRDDIVAILFDKELKGYVR